MKKTVTINLSGFIFNIDEDAYNKLNEYLTLLKNHFTKQEEGHEIIADIESRITELFKERTGSSRQVITIEDVEDVIAMLGTPEMIIGEDEEESSDSEEEKQERRKSKHKDNKRFYRDVDNRVLGGVCSGLAAYFDIDPVIIRVLMIILFFAFGPLLYIVLWIAIPPAKTTAERLRMKGEKINVKNIENSIKEEFESVKENFHKYRKSKHWDESTDFIHRLIALIGTIIHAVFKIIFAAIGFIIVITGIVLLLSFTGVFYFDSIGPTGINISDIWTMFVSPSSVTILLTGLFIIIGVPILFILYGIVRFLFGINTRSRIVNSTGFMIWIIGLFFLIGAVVNESLNYRSDGYITENVQLNQITKDTLYVSIKGYDESLEDVTLFDHDYAFDRKFKDGIIYAYPKIEIVKNDSPEYELVLKKNARGESKKKAEIIAGEIKYKVEQHDSVLVLPSYFEITKQSKWRIQNLKLILKVPENKSVFLNKDLEYNLDYLDNDENIYGDDVFDKVWTMKQHGLELK